MFDWFGAMPESISTYGSNLDDLMRLIFWIVVPWFALAEGLILYSLFRFRRRDGVRAAWMPANTAKWQAIILVPAAIVLFCDIVIEHASNEVWQEIMLDMPDGAETMVRVTGRQYSWTFQYPGPDATFDTDDDIISVGEMHVPKDEPVRFELRAADVLHAFWVPELRFKQDAVPGRGFDRWFQATKSGTYEIGCAELCGTGHTLMAAKLIVESPEDFRQWLGSKAEE